jgi:hypothetical protein
MGTVTVVFTKEDWDKPIDTLIEALNLDEHRIFVRRASAEQLKDHRIPNG